MPRLYVAANTHARIPSAVRVHKGDSTGQICVTNQKALDDRIFYSVREQTKNKTLLRCISSNSITRSQSRSRIPHQRRDKDLKSTRRLCVREFFPAAREATLVKSAVIKEVHATYSPRPGIDARRPEQITGWPRVFMAGDWTATGWPATMEGAVRSGYLAAEALMSAAGMRSKGFLAPELPASGLMRIMR